MDKVSKLLSEARPLYLKKQREKYALISSFCSLCLVVVLLGILPKAPTFDEGEFDCYFTALYLNDGVVDDIDDDSVIPLDKFGLYEVS
jgi:uncharacterized membrane protein